MATAWFLRYLTGAFPDWCPPDTIELESLPYRPVAELNVEADSTDGIACRKVDGGMVVVLLVKKLGMGMRRTQTGWLRPRGRLGVRIALGFVLCACAGAEETEPGPMLERMRANFVIESGTSIGNHIEAEVTWRMKEGGPALRSGNVVDQWHVLGEGERYGTERFRQSPDGNRRTRTVYQGGERREFEFDLNAAGEEAVTGEFHILHQFNRSPTIRLPLQEYLDRVLSPPNRGGFVLLYEFLEIAEEMASIDGHPCHEIRGKWNGRNFTLWLDPAYGYLPRQYTVQVVHAAEFSGRRRGWRDPAEMRLLAPPPELGQRVIPIRSEERLSAVELMQRGGRFYMANAVLERTQYIEGGAVYSHRAVLQTGDYVFGGRRDVTGFLDFDGLIRNGTPVEEIWPGDRENPERVERYVLSDGKKLPHYGSFKEYMGDLGNDLARLSRDFSIENLQRIDSKFLVAVCAAAALLINGGIAYANYRKNRPKPS